MSSCFWLFRGTDTGGESDRQSPCGHQGTAIGRVVSANNSNNNNSAFQLSFNGSTVSCCMTVFVLKISQPTDGYSRSICLVNFRLHQDQSAKGKKVHVIIILGLGWRLTNVSGDAREIMYFLSTILFGGPALQFSGRQRNLYSSYRTGLAPLQLTWF